MKNFTTVLFYVHDNKVTNSSNKEINPVDVNRVTIVKVDGNLAHQLDLKYNHRNNLSMTFPNTGTIEAILEYRDNCGGIYLKWLNTYGGWDYFLFSKKYKVKSSNNSIGEINSDFDNPQNVNSVTSQLGKTQTTSYLIRQEFLNERQFRKIAKLSVSPKVYMWINKKFIEVSINVKNQYTSTSQSGVFEFEIDLHKKYTQTI